jgi:alpha-acetolactate decarboxylase
MRKKTTLDEGTATATSLHATTVVLLAMILILCSRPSVAETWDGRISHYGEMRVVLGQGRHEGRVRLGDLTKTAHCYAVGALAGLAGEITIIDGQFVVSRVDRAGQPTTDSEEPGEHEATMLVAAYVPSWTERRIERDVPAEELESFVRAAAQEAGIDTAKPFPFLIEGELIGLEAHVINGACPMRARRFGLSIAPAQRPYHGSFVKTSGRLVGIYAQNAEHRLTHHGTKTHTHVLLIDDNGQAFTAHVERTGVRAGSVLRLPDR